MRPKSWISWSTSSPASCARFNFGGPREQDGIVALSLRVQSPAKILRIYGFCVRNRTYDFGVYTSYLVTWTLRVQGSKYMNTTYLGA